VKTLPVNGCGRLDDTGAEIGGEALGVVVVEHGSSGLIAE
jgi:hypothetical protein